jgi:Nif-specific regulatory protein
LTGDNGTGKTQLARAIHDNSPRAAGPFVELNCAALPEELIENELFGAAVGGHSTAAKRVLGKVEAAEGGTLFFDEIGELPLRAQAKLLQLLQSAVYFPLGQSEAQRANVRVIAATNADLRAAVAERRFREDLYYRLGVFPIRMPSLAERRSDIPALAGHYCKTTSAANSLPAYELSPGAVVALEHADWPGNVRELAHTVEAAVVRASGEKSPYIERRHLFPTHAPGPAGTAPAARTFHEATRVFQEQLLREALAREGWNVAAAARTLDLTRAHVYNLMATFSIARPEASDER